MRHIIPARMKPLLLLIISLILAAACAVQISSADPVLAYATDGYSDPRADVFAPRNGGSAVRMFDISLSDWDVSGDRQRKRHRDVDGRICMMCEIPSPEQADGEYFGYAAFKITLDEYAGAHDTLIFGIIAEEGGETPIPVEVNVTAVSEEITARVWITPGEWNLVTVDASALESRITEMNITASYGTEVPASVSITKPYLTKKRPAGLKYAEAFASNRWTPIEGNAQIKTGWISPDNGRAQIVAPLVTDQIQVPGSPVYFEIALEDVISGNMTLGVLYEGAAEEQREYQRKLSLNAQDGVYTVPVQADARIVSYALRFENIVTDGEGFTVRSVRLCSEGRGIIEGNADIGRVDSIVRTGSEIVFSGVIEREAAVLYGEEKLHFYAIPGWEADDLSSAVDLGSVKMTTRFQYTVSLSSFGAAAAADTFRFFAGIPTEGGILPLSHPVYPDAGKISAGSSSNMGMYGGSSVGVFESNASHVMVEIPLDRLVLSSGGISVPYQVLGASADTGEFSFGGTRSLHLNEELIRELDGEIAFYLSAGIRVYLRLTAASPVKGLTYGGDSSENYAVRVTDNEARQMYACFIRTLSARWSGISGIALGRAVNYSGLVGGKALDNPAAYTADLAEICRITYNAASAYIPGIAVIVPYAEYRDGYDPDKWLADRTVSVMLADRLDEMGAIPWVLMYSVDSADDDLTSPVSLSRMLTDLELDSPAGIMVFWQPDSKQIVRDFLLEQSAGDDSADLSGYIAGRFADLCERSAAFRARAVFLSMADMPDGAGYDFYEYLKNESAGDSGRLVWAQEAVNTYALSEHDAVIDLWNFAESHHTMDWIAGSGITSCLTGYSVLLSDAASAETGERQYIRALRADVENSGIVLCRFDSTRSFREIEGIDFTVALESADGGTEAVLVFVIGTEDTRAQFTAGEIRSGEVRSFHCGFADYPNPDEIDYVGIIVYADCEVTLEVGKVSAHTSKLDADALAALLAGEKPGGEAKADYRLALILCAVTVLMSAAALTAITRHEKEETEEPEKKTYGG